MPCRGSCGDDGLEHFQSLDSFRKAIYWVVSFGRIHLVLCLAMLKVLLWKFGSQERLSYMAIIPAYNRHSLRLCLGSCRVSLVEGVS